MGVFSSVSHKCSFVAAWIHCKHGRISRLFYQPFHFQPLAPRSELGYKRKNAAAARPRSAPLACDVNITLQQRRRIRCTAASTFVYRLAKASCDGRARVPERCHGDPRDALQSGFCSLSASKKPSRLQLARRLALISVFIGHRLPPAVLLRLVSSHGYLRRALASDWLRRSPLLKWRL